MSSKTTRHITSLLVVLAVVAVGIFLQTSTASQKGREPSQALSPANTPSPTLSSSPKVAPAEASSRPEKTFARLPERRRPWESSGPNFRLDGARDKVIIDDKRAPQWFIRRSVYLDEEQIHQREEAIWLFQDNHRRIVPQPKAKRGWFAASPEETEIDEACYDVLRARLKDSYRYQVSNKAKIMEKDRSNFQINLATSEYQTPQWRDGVIGELVERTGVKPEQIKLTVPPPEKTGTDEWVEGKTHRK